MRQNCRRVRRDQAADHQADEPDGQKLQHRRIRDVVTNQTRVEMRERLLDVRQLRVDQDRTQGDQNPGPRPQHVVGDIEEEHRAEGVAFGLRRQHALGDIAAAPGLCAWVPDGPPLDGDRHDEDSHGHVPVVRKVGQDVQVVHAAAMTAVILMKN